MDKQTFITQYIASFLASYAAFRYDHNCSYGKKNHHPVEDAKFLAEEAWEQLQLHN